MLTANSIRLKMHAHAAAYMPAAVLACLALTASCGRGDRHAHDSKAREAKPFHADNDIGMTVRSLTDALRVGEPFDSSAYDFTGILTDGVGAPLYIDSMSNPGTWRVRIAAPTRAEITNLHGGDLVGNDLVGYLSYCLDLKRERMVSHHRNDRSEERVYRTDHGYITFEGMGDEGLDGCRIVISISDTIY